MKFWPSKLKHPDISQPIGISALKDFLYLDVERVRSFVAQFYEGLPETRTRGGKKSEDINATLGYEAIAKAGAKVLTEKNISETQSLHLALYDIFEREAIYRGLIQQQVTDAPLVKLKCQIRLVDYQEMSEKINLFSELMPLINKLQSQDSQYTKSQKKEQQKSEKQQKEQFESMSRIIEMLFGNEILGIGYVDGQTIFTTRLQKELLQLKHTGLISSSEDILTEEWVVVGMVVQKQNKPEEQESTDPLAMAIRDMNSAFDNIKQQLQSSDEDQSQIIPIAIYREIIPTEKKRENEG